MDNVGTMKSGRFINKDPKKKYILRKCHNCEDLKWVYISHTRTKNYTGLCSTCTKPGTEKNSHVWKGGRYVRYGYVYIYKPDHPLSRSSGYILEHRFIASKKWGIDAVMGMDVHHKDGNKSNNSIENLELLSKREHISLHRSKNSKQRTVGEENPIISCKCGCGSEFNKYDKWGRPRMYKHGHRRRTNG